MHFSRYYAGALGFEKYRTCAARTHISGQPDWFWTGEFLDAFHNARQTRRFLQVSNRFLRAYGDADKVLNH